MTDLQSFTLMMASAQVVETSVNTNNSPSQDYTTNPDDHSINHNKCTLSRKAVYVNHLAGIKMCKEKKEETERERMERLSKEYSDID